MSTDLNMEYQEVKFGEIAKHISKRVEPSETTLEVYVGLEHLDPDSLKITRHGVPSDVAGQKLLVKKGQIIFGKRRAYQRKVAVAHWDCICSAHAMVLEAIPGKILPEFLPFFMQSNQFMEKAVEISEGSLSPTIKWKNLEQQIFRIPSIELQQKLLINLKKIESIEFQIQQIEILTTELLHKLRLKFFYNMNHPISLLSRNVLLKGGSTFKPAYQGKTKGFLPFIKVSDMNHDNNKKYILHSENWLDQSDVEKLKVSIFPKGACVFAKVGAALLLNRRRILDQDTAIDNNMMAAIPNNKVETDYLYHFMCTLDFKYFVQEGAVPSVNQKFIGDIEFPLPTLAKQKEFTKSLNNLEEILENIEVKKLNYKKLKSTILSEIK